MYLHVPASGADASQRVCVGPERVSAAGWGGMDVFI